MLPNFGYVRAGSLPEAIERLEADGARVHAGGTDLLGCLRDGVFTAKEVVCLSGIQELTGIGETGDGALRIGAMARVSQVAAHPLIARRYGALAMAAAAVASPQLRNQGTLGGNLCQKPRCWYYRGEFHCLRKGGTRCFAVDGQNQYHCIFGGMGCYIVHPSDTAPALAALQAKVRTAGPKGKREVPADAFHVPPSEDPTLETVLGPGDVVTDILLPEPLPGLRSSYRKVRGRRSWDFALAGVALALRFDGPRVTEARVFLSGVAPVPWRSRETEAAITGRELSDDVIGDAAKAAVAGAEPLSRNRFKVTLLRGLIEEQLAAIRSG
jgi:xanthine dehydrogenase YagS FAD-binding subunit